MDDDDQTEPPVSKSQLKRDADRAQDLGRALLDLTESDWAKLALPDTLVAALSEARRIQSHGARKRQLQYIGKLMRSIDVQPIADYLEALQLGRRQTAQAHHDLESWRERLIEDGDAAISALLAEHAGIDAKQLGGLVRQAQAERNQGGTPRAARALFRFLREALAGPP